MRADLNLQSHLLRMRITAVAALAVVIFAAIAAFVLPYRGSAVASPRTVTLVALAASLWIGFSANRDATGRLERIRRAFAVHGDEGRLLREHWLVYLAVLFRLGMMVVAGLVVALWGSGPTFGIWILIMGGLMVVLTWPTTRKTQLLLGRARALRGDS
ncbi:MAG: hypothetical protein IFK93_15200 [Acidobacteria bacterium]|nr:hypothetical protein [Candidatus Sulfomarinibacter kjeldsenii]